MLETALFATALVLTAAGVALFKRLGITAKLVDVPNQRSSHRTPTVRGAGAVVVLVCLSLFVAASVVLGSEIEWPYLIGAVLVSGVSWADDFYSLPASVRFVAHAIAAAILIFGSGVFAVSYIPVFGSTISLGWFGPLITYAWIVWMINAYNFMDGIDGIAGIQAVVAGIGWAMIGMYFGDQAIYMFGGVLAFSAIGFLIHNWEPASVFMGDVGSAFLGYTFAAMPIMALDAPMNTVGWMLPAGLGLVWLFWMDTIYTFLRRLYRGEKFWQAHREHLYQRLIISGSHHGRVSALYGALGAAVSILVVLAISVGGWFEHVFLAACLLSAGAVIFLAHRKND